MNKKMIIYIMVGIFIFLLILSSFDVIRFNSNSQKNLNENIPAECRKPEGQSLEAWKEHLGHHQNTLYCLEYFKNP